MTTAQKRILVTGGAGFIGSHLVERLVADGSEVVVLDNLSTGHSQNLASVADEIRFVEGDIRDRDLVWDAMLGAELVYHQAALASVPESLEQPQLYFDVNVTGTLNVLTAAHHLGVKRIVFASSSAVYGNSPESPKREDMTPSPLSPYALSKLVGEQMCTLFRAVYGLETIVLRYFNVYGPRQNPDSPYAAVIPKFIDDVLQGRRPIVFGDGEQSRGFIFVRDVVNANIKAGTIQEVTEPVLNVASDTSLTVNRALGLIAEELATESNPAFLPPRLGDIRHSVADISRLRRCLSLDELTPMDTGISMTVAHFESSRVGL